MTTVTIYALRAGDGPYVKIGYATNLQRRLNNLQIGCPEDLRVVWSKLGTVAEETALHDALRSRWRRGEWFDFGGMADAEVAAILAAGGVAPDPHYNCRTDAMLYDHPTRSRQRREISTILTIPGAEPMPVYVTDHEAFSYWLTTTSFGVGNPPDVISPLARARAGLP